jgi:hypothetical protein
MDRIRSRIYVEKVSGISAADREAFLQVCSTYEQEDRPFEDGDEQQDADLHYQGTFTDFDKYATRR